MSTKRRKLVHGTEPPEPLPVDLLLEIVARTGVATVVRCAAASKTLRRAILDPAFARRRFALLEAESTGVFDDFDPSLLLGVSYQEPSYLHGGKSTLNTIQLCARLDDGCHLLRDDSFTPVAARDGLLVLRHYQRLDVLRVCDVFSGRVTLLPPTAICEAYAPHVLLITGGSSSSSSFELLIADARMNCFQTFSSMDGKWSGVRQASKPQHPDDLRLDESCNPTVVGRTIYWLFSTLAVLPDRILALDIDSAEATMVAFPTRCLSWMMAVKKGNHLLLASVRGRLSLFVSETQGISMWTRTPAQSKSAPAAWSRQVVICRAEVEMQARRLGLGLGTCHYVTYGPFLLVGFGERSGAVILQLIKGELLRLDLGPNVISKLRSPAGTLNVDRVFLHEMDLVSLLQSMKPSLHSYVLLDHDSECCRTRPYS